jgi:hypothetical protein
MKAVLIATFLMVSSHCCASSDALANTLNWLQTLAPQNLEFKMTTSAIKFNGCKQKEYLASLNQPITKNITLEMGLGYAKGAHSWGIFNQNVSVKEFFFIPRYQFSHDVSIGFGVIAQSQTEFKTTKGLSTIYQKIPSGWLIHALMVLLLIIIGSGLRQAKSGVLQMRSEGYLKTALRVITLA